MHVSDLIDGLANLEAYATLLKAWGALKTRLLDEELMANLIFASKACEMESKACQALNAFSSASAADQQLDKMSPPSIIAMGWQGDNSEDQQGNMDESMSLRSCSHKNLAAFGSPLPPGESHKGLPEKKAASRWHLTMGDKPSGAIQGLSRKHLTNKEWSFIHHLHVQEKKNNAGRHVPHGFWENVVKMLSLDKRGITNKDCCSLYYKMVGKNKEDMVTKVEVKV
ncbi:hypothetical protein DACRYDRAFT_16207 [Dacryopinax primogenitus]|uniref:Uncharacterized protein n=1 Tax=Dacryopinax primogenitus (strain DJM 731) TaxID=1858805 RepID=M5GBY4_DACPD|nr:uncharacterized protein DACRYDRAFT_16207 [Dacryopinax primogenitus]EJU01538.1 hypothetical protein DACRYDRAFT_16207 [Dacryopinax primogenitus]